MFIYYGQRTKKIAHLLLPAFFCPVSVAQKTAAMVTFGFFQAKVLTFKKLKLNK